ncbi:MAG TPA: EAL domain-containing protein [Chloroflexota bacterium]|nr:EAL domain-containing protein [Chloroflexota bacterium]
MVGNATQEHRRRRADHALARVADGLTPARRRTLLPYAVVAIVCLVLGAALRASSASVLTYGLALVGLLLTGVIVMRLLHALHAADVLTLNNQALSAANEELSAANRYLQLLTTTDPLTGLSNRTLLYQQLERSIATGPRARAPFALLLLDMDRFKAVNDSLGHRYGDLLLQQVALRLRNALQPADLAARLGGDEFALLLPETDQVSAMRTALRIRRILETPFQVEGHVLRVGASLGVALCPEHGTDVHTLLRCVDIAMYQAKRAQSGAVLYSVEGDSLGEWRTLTGDLRQALTQEQLVLHYQPKLQLATNRVYGVEALVRWLHPERGLIRPDTFIPLAEQTGLIMPLTQWVLERALQQSHAWSLAGLQLSIAVNLSIQNLEDPQLPDLVAVLLSRYAVAPESLTLEITESTLMADPEPALAVLKRLATIGVRIAIDDFGTGYSSLGYLKQLPVNEVKIDKVFVRGLGATQTASAIKDRMIVRAVTALAHAMGLAVVAEGVEDQAVWELLTDLRCNAVQGNHLSPPLPAADLERWLRTFAAPVTPPAASDGERLSLARSG